MNEIVTLAVQQTQVVKGIALVIAVVVVDFQHKLVSET